MQRIKELLLSEDTHGYLLAALLISLPLPYAFSSITTIVLGSLAFFSFLIHKKVVWKKAYWAPFGLFLLMVCSLLWSENVDKSMRGLERQLPFLILPLAFLFMPTLSKDIWKKVLYRFAVGIALFALFFIAVAAFKYIQNGNREDLFYHGLVAVFELNAIYVSCMTALSLLYMAFYAKRSWFNVAVAGILFVFLLLLSSKNMVIVTLLCAFIGFWISKRFFSKKRVLILGVVAIGAVVAFLFSPLKQRMEEEFTSNVKEVLTCEEFNRVYPWTGTTIRLFQARIFYEMANENDTFLSGFGINASQEKIVEKQNHYNLYWGYNVYNFHNQYIQAFSELGVFGFVGILLLLFFMLKGYLNTRELFLLFFLIVMASVFVTESYIWRQRGMLHFLVLYGMMAKIPLGNTLEKKMEESSQEAE
ncbi:O-antigen ligase family protein [Aureisphaera galaxeae]|uniref:O-antigen ligase family protein n=1 Tax=Aureisphaera galaxeae TaxID=1538023 RepID=UPI002350AA6B|nr:O-antigen ligase family protein [Aureisphaera galaxeae]MDC8005071.1 O-antigen ligase family protein [Aureisphaera galaxeae]